MQPANNQTPDGWIDLATLANMYRPPIPQRRIKRWLLKMQVRVKAALPDSEPFLFQLTEAGNSKYMVCLPTLRVYAKGLMPSLDGSGFADDSESRAREEEMLSTIRSVAEDTAVIRRAVGR